MIVRASAQNVDLNLVQPYLRCESERSEYLQRIDCSRRVLFYTVISDDVDLSNFSFLISLSSMRLHATSGFLEVTRKYNIIDKVLFYCFIS